MYVLIAKRIVHNSYNVINMCIDTEVTGRAFAVWRGVELAALPFKQVSSGRQSQTLSENEKVRVGARKDEDKRLMTRFGLLEVNMFHW